MDIEKAIEWQRAFKKIYKGMPKEVDDACDMAIEALKKQVAKKPNTNKYYYFCPNCGTRRSIKQKHNYCHECGQAISLEED